MPRGQPAEPLPAAGSRRSILPPTDQLPCAGLPLFTSDSAHLVIAGAFEEGATMVYQDRSGSLEKEGVEALALMGRALELIDTFDPCGTIAPHLDLAIARLRDRLGPDMSKSND